MKKLLFVLLLALPISLANAGQSEDKIKNEAAKAAARNYASQVVKNYVNRLAGAKEVKGGVTPGGQLVSGINLAFSLKALSEAKSDKEKAYALATATADGVSIANPAVGGIMHAAILVAALSESVMTAAVAADINRLVAETMRNYARIAEIENAFTQADQIMVQFYLQSLMANQTLGEETKQQLSQNCSNLQNEKKLDVFESCLSLVRQYHTALQIQLSSLKGLLTYQIRSSDLRADLAAKGIGEQVLKSKLEILSKELVRNDKLVEQAIHAFARAYADLISEKYASLSNDSLIETAAKNCRSQVEHLVSRIEIAKVSHLIKPKNPLQSDLVKIDRSSILSEIEEIEDGVCSEIKATKITDRILQDNFVEVMKEFSEAAAEYRQVLGALR